MFFGVLYCGFKWLHSGVLVSYNVTERHTDLILQFAVYKNCAEVYKSGNKISGVYKIDPDGLGEFNVFCDQKTAGGGWTVVQKRFDGSVDFFRAWDDYKRGFGNLNGEFWLGLDRIHRLTVSSNYKLRVDLEDTHGKTVFAEYSSFSVANETAKYQLSLGSYAGEPLVPLLSYFHFILVAVNEIFDWEIFYL